MGKRIRISTIRWWGLVLVPATACAPLATSFAPATFSEAGSPDTYSVAAWQATLREHVKPDGVNYRALAEQSRPVEEFVGMLAKVGPVTMPRLFPNRSARLAYWLNAYNASVVSAVVRAGVPATMHDPADIPFRDRVRVRIDGRSMTLNDLREKIGGEAGGDHRVWFCLTDAARGSPPLYDQAFDSVNLAEQVVEAVRRAMADPNMVRVDHSVRELLLGVPIIEHQDALVEFCRKTSGKPDADILDAVMALAGSMRGTWFAHARGYPVKIIPFDPILNQSQN